MRKTGPVMISDGGHGALAAGHADDRGRQGHVADDPRPATGRLSYDTGTKTVGVSKHLRSKTKGFVALADATGGPPPPTALVGLAELVPTNFLAVTAK